MSVKKKKVPMRMCVGCQEMKSKKELIRIVKNKDNEISVDFVGKKPGRGAYICRNISCLESARKSKRLERAFETSISDEVYQLLKEELEGNNAQ